MRKLLKNALRAVWRLSAGVRRRLAERIDRHLIAQFEPWLARVDRAHAQNQLLARDVELLGDAIIRELARLQSHVEALDERLQAVVPIETDVANARRGEAPRRQAA
ncbi:MAG TPA: hypothetical protein VFW87_20050 [Pirellulales bacterium]|nr:hypothetical protein [Pirellulales bacterium]